MPHERMGYWMNLLYSEEENVSVFQRDPRNWDHIAVGSTRFGDRTSL